MVDNLSTKHEIMMPPKVEYITLLPPNDALKPLKILPSMHLYS